MLFRSAGATLGDYLQELWGVDATFSRGPVVLRGEFFHDGWQVPNVADAATDLSGYLEAQTDLAPGVWIAGRIGAIHYDEVAGQPGTRAPWDYDIRRVQLAGGYRVARSVEVKAEAQRTHSNDPRGADADLLSLQLWCAF